MMWLSIAMLVYTCGISRSHIPWWIRGGYAITLQSWLTAIAVHAFSVHAISDNSDLTMAAIQQWFTITNLWLDIVPVLWNEVILFALFNVALYIGVAYCYWISLHYNAHCQQRWILGWYSLPIFTLALAFTFLAAPAVIVGLVFSLLGLLFASNPTPPFDNTTVIDEATLPLQ